MKAGGSCRDGFGGAIRQFWNPTKSCGWKAKGAGQESQERVEAAGRVLEVLSVSFETLQKAPARPRASGSCREGSFETLQKVVAGRPREPGASS